MKLEPLNLKTLVRIHPNPEHRIYNDINLRLGRIKSFGTTKDGMDIYKIAIPNGFLSEINVLLHDDNEFESIDPPYIVWPIDGAGYEEQLEYFYYHHVRFGFESFDDIFEAEAWLKINLPGKFHTTYGVWSLNNGEVSLFAIFSHRLFVRVR